MSTATELDTAARYFLSLHGTQLENSSLGTKIVSFIKHVAWSSRHTFGRRFTRQGWNSSHNGLFDLLIFLDMVGLHDIAMQLTNDVINSNCDISAIKLHTRQTVYRLQRVLAVAETTVTQAISALKWQRQQQVLQGHNVDAAIVRRQMLAETEQERYQSIKKALSKCYTKVALDLRDHDDLNHDRYEFIVLLQKPLPFYDAPGVYLYPGTDGWRRRCWNVLFIHENGIKETIDVTTVVNNTYKPAIQNQLYEQLSTASVSLNTDSNLKHALINHLTTGAAKWVPVDTVSPQRVTYFTVQELLKDETANALRIPIPDAMGIIGDNAKLVSLEHYIRANSGLASLPSLYTVEHDVSYNESYRLLYALYWLHKHLLEENQRWLLMRPSCSNYRQSIRVAINEIKEELLTLPNATATMQDLQKTIGDIQQDMEQAAANEGSLRVGIIPELLGKFQSDLADMERQSRNMYVVNTGINNYKTNARDHINALNYRRQKEEDKRAAIINLIGNAALLAVTFTESLGVGYPQYVNDGGIDASVFAAIISGGTVNFILMYGCAWDLARDLILQRVILDEHGQELTGIKKFLARMAAICAIAAAIGFAALAANGTKATIVDPLQGEYGLSGEIVGRSITYVMALSLGTVALSSMFYAYAIRLLKKDFKKSFASNQKYYFSYEGYIKRLGCCELDLDDKWERYNRITFYIAFALMVLVFCFCTFGLGVSVFGSLGFFKGCFFMAMTNHSLMPVVMPGINPFSTLLMKGIAPLVNAPFYATGWLIYFPQRLCSLIDVIMHPVLAKDRIVTWWCETDNKTKAKVIGRLLIRIILLTVLWPNIHGQGLGPGESADTMSDYQIAAGIIGVQCNPDVAAAMATNAGTMTSANNNSDAIESYTNSPERLTLNEQAYANNLYNKLKENKKDDDYVRASIDRSSEMGKIKSRVRTVSYGNIQGDGSNGGNNLRQSLLDDSDDVITVPDVQQNSTHNPNDNPNNTQMKTMPKDGVPEVTTVTPIVQQPAPAAVTCSIIDADNGAKGRHTTPFFMPAAAVDMPVTDAVTVVPEVTATVSPQQPVAPAAVSCTTIEADSGANSHKAPFFMPAPVAGMSVADIVAAVPEVTKTDSSPVPPAAVSCSTIDVNSGANSDKVSFFMPAPVAGMSAADMVKADRVTADNCNVSSAACSLAAAAVAA